MIKIKNNQISKIYLNDKAINKLYLEKYKLFYYFDYPQILKDFLNNIPEFKPLFLGENEVMIFLSKINQVKCDFQEYKDLKNDKKCDLNHFFLLVAHYLVLSGFTKSINILPLDGLVSSSSVGDVSVSYQASPYSTKGNEFTYWLSLTSYGRMYLAWLSRQAGLRIVN